MSLDSAVKFRFPSCAYMHARTRSAPNSHEAPMVEIPKGKVGVHNCVLTAGNVTVVSFPEVLAGIEIITDGTTDIYYTLNGEDPDVPNGDNTVSNAWRIPAGPGIEQRAAPWYATSTVKLAATNPAKVTVQRPSPKY